jgi:protein-tyrosine phosphatase
MLKDRFHLSDVYDFRFDAEAEANPDRSIDGVTITRLSTLPEAFIAAFTSGRADTTQIQSATILEALAKYAFLPQAQEMAGKLYPAIVMDTLSQRLYGEFLKGVLNAEGGVLWHCSQGKDRAGWGTAFVLAALGADRKTIVEDFSLSNVSYAPAVEAISERITQMGGGEGELAFIRAMVGVSVENFESTLDLIEAQYGSLEAYLEKALGFSAEEQAALQSKLLE